MAKFFIVDTQACYVRWRFPVEAKNEVEALEKYANGDHGEAEGEPEIGDSLDYVGPFDLDVEKAGA